MIGRCSCVAAGVMSMLGTAHAAEPLYTFTQADRLEYQSDDGVFAGDLQGWYGGDYHKLWWKLEGESDDGSVEDIELQLLYSRAWTSYFDLQFGVQYVDDDTEEFALAIGVQGLAPYRFEVDAAAFLTEEGDLLLRGEFERDILLTQKWVLQPRLEVSAALQDVPERTLSRGITDVAAGVRIRYEVKRKFAPYIGLEWTRVYGEAADAVRAGGEDISRTSLIAGLRFWF